MPSRLLRSLPVGLVTSVITMAAATAAHAGVLVSSAENCTAETLSQPFLPWIDPAQYTPLPGGSFENGSDGWTLGGASVGAGNESYNVGGPGDSHSLSLPAGSSATSASICVGIQNPTLRFFARNSGSPASTLRVDVLFEDSLGNQLSATIGTVSASGAWNPTAQLPVLVNMLPLLPGDETAVAFRFTPQGNGNWQIDDAFVDPWGRT